MDGKAFTFVLGASLALMGYSAAIVFAPIWVKALLVAGVGAFMAWVAND